MRQREYQFIFFLNIKHSFYSETELGKKHSHTWELEVSMHPMENELVRFREVEQVIQDYLERFQDKYLNMIKPFDRLNPSIENFLDHVAGDIDQRMREKDWEIKELRISENPTRTYAIDRLRMDELEMHTDMIGQGVTETVMAEAAVTEAVAEPESSPATEDAKKPETDGCAAKVTKQEVPVPKLVTNWLIDTKELRVKTQTAGNMTRIVITVP